MNISKPNHQECVLILLLETTQLAVWRIDPEVPKEAPTPTEPVLWPWDPVFPEETPPEPAWCPLFFDESFSLRLFLDELQS